VVIGHKAKAQQAQVTVSGIGARDADGLHGLQTHKISLGPVHDTSEAPAVQADTVQAGTEDGMQADAPTLAVADASTAAADVPEPAVVPSESPLPGIPVVPAEQDSEHPTADAAPALTEAVKPAEELMEADPLAAVALEPDAPAPEAAVPEHPKLPIPEVPDDDPVHSAAEPSLKGQVVVSHHSVISEGNGKIVLLMILLVLFLLIVADILLDVGVITLSGVPHTHLF
jgi:hypothetical protein